MNNLDISSAVAAKNKSTNGNTTTSLHLPFCSMREISDEEIHSNSKTILQTNEKSKESYKVSNQRRYLIQNSQNFPRTFKENPQVEGFSLQVIRFPKKKVQMPLAVQPQVDSKGMLSSIEEGKHSLSSSRQALFPKILVTLSIFYLGLFGLLYSFGILGNDDEMPLYISHRSLQSDNSTEVARTPGQIALDFFLVILLVSLSGTFSGLTLGLMSLDKIGLEIVMGGHPESDDAKYAARILPVRKKGNLLLCTLLFGNTLVNATLSIVLASYTGGLVGTVISTGTIFLLGELLPQAAGSKHALWIGGHTIWVVYFFMTLFYVIVKPVSLVLDCIFKEEVGAVYTTSELRKLVEIHVKHKQLDEEQAKMMGGAIHYKDETVQDVMTPKSNIFMIDVETVLDFPAITKIFQSGYSRIPVYSETTENIVGLMLTKDLIVIDPEEGLKVKAIIQFFGRPVFWLWPDTKLSEALKLFKSGKSHLALVRRVIESESTDPFYEFCGLITLEDIIEEIIGDEIVDETDIYVNVEDFNSKVVDRATFDFARLRLLDPKHASELSEEEIQAVTAHLSRNVSALAIYDAKVLEAVVRSTPVLEFQKGELIYRRDKPITHFTLVLQGKMQIVAGQEGFLSEAGPWTSLGTQALLYDDGSFNSDFTAKVVSESIKCIRFSKGNLVAAKLSTEEPRHGYEKDSSSLPTDPKEGEITSSSVSPQED